MAAKSRPEVDGRGPGDAGGCDRGSCVRIGARGGCFRGVVSTMLGRAWGLHRQHGWQNPTQDSAVSSLPAGEDGVRQWVEGTWETWERGSLERGSAAVWCVAGVRRTGGFLSLAGARTPLRLPSLVVRRLTAKKRAFVHGFGRVRALVRRDSGGGSKGERRELPNGGGCDRFFRLLLGFVRMAARGPKGPG